MRRHAGGFIEHDEIEAVAAQFVGIMGAADGDHAAFGQIDAALCMTNYYAGQMFYGAHQVAPDLARHPVGGRQPPAAFVLHVSGVEDVGFAQLRLAPAASASQHFEAGWALQDGLLAGVGPHEGYGGRRI